VLKLWGSCHGRLSSDVRTSDGIQLHPRRWLPESGCRAAVCLVHGLGEHSGRYQHFGEAFAAHGLGVYTFDLRGHGQSGGRRSHTPSYGALLDDIDLLIEMAQTEQRGVPLFLYGHSLGGALVINHVLRWQPPIVGAIVSAPALRPGFEPPRWKLAVARFAASVWPTLRRASELDPMAISRDSDVVERYLSDPLMNRSLTARLGIAALDEGERALAEAHTLTIPLLLMHGTGDRLTDPEASRCFAAAAGDLCTLQLFEGLYHELHNEPEQTDVLGCVFDWIDGRAEPP
jgi:acylglycerol lipase